ncbi:MAG: hypothetical protein PWQ85_1011 [Geotoga sp.]|jgi:sugar O-acyltransferase (sialic acid O-acetyltransferase NeuD family)|nr:hypothetical protein [Geotoga sp.]
MAKLLILGASGHGRVVAEIATLMKQWDEISFLDDNEELNHVNGYKVIDRLKNYRLYKDEYENAFVAIGNNQIRLRLINELLKAGFSIPVLIHPKATISNNVFIDIGTVVMAGAVINTNTVIGKGCIINTSSSVDHDCVLGDGVHISPGAHVGGTVHIGRCTWVCIGSSISNNITIGENVVIAAGAVVIRDIRDNVMVAGVPATFKKNLE